MPWLCNESYTVSCVRGRVPPATQSPDPREHCGGPAAQSRQVFQKLSFIPSQEWVVWVGGRGQWKGLSSE